jgi:hypothetical protein
MGFVAAEGFAWSGILGRWFLGAQFGDLLEKSLLAVVALARDKEVPGRTDRSSLVSARIARTE